MHHSHQLEKQKHKDFLLQQRVDPITGELIKAGHKIVICSACKSAFFEESWEYLGGKHCNQKETLIQIPINETLWLKAKPLQFLPFDFEGFDQKLYSQNLIYYSTKAILAIAFIISTLAALDVFEQGRILLFLLLSLSAIISLIALTNTKILLFNFPVYYHKYIIPIADKHKLAIDLKNQLFIFRSDFNEINISFDTISEICYSFNYVENDESRYKDLCSLKVVFYFKNNNKEEMCSIKTDMRKIHLNKWEDFLQKIPFTIKSRRFKQIYS